MASEWCAEWICLAKPLGTMGSPFTAREFLRTCRGLYRKVQMKRSGNTEFGPSSFLKKMWLFFTIKRRILWRVRNFI